MESPESNRHEERSTVPLIRVIDVSKPCGGARALRGVSCDTRRGGVLAFGGATGAAKSTLIRCLAGIHLPDAGTIEIDGHEQVIGDPDAATALRLAFIHQEMSLIPGWDVMRNMALGSKPRTRFGIIDWRATRERAREVADLLGFTVSLTAKIDTLSTAEKSLVLIGRALMQDARMIAMDEPTASLSAVEADRLHQIIRDLAAKGTAVIFVSHRLDEVSDLCTDITVFKDGEVTKRIVGERASKSELVRAIVGKDLVIAESGQTPAKHGEAVLEVRDIEDARVLRGVSLTVHAGEVLGLGGLVGAGRTELANIIYGATQPTGGEVLLDGKRVSFRQPADAARAGIGLVPEERRSEGLFLDHSIEFNINVSTLDSLVLSRVWPFLNRKESRRRAQEVADAVTVKASTVSQLVGSLSGGNQQKVAIARWLVNPPRLLILDEPSRGVDVGARAEVHKVIRDLASRGTAVLAISSDNEELVGLCDRVLVMAEGRITGEVSESSLTIDEIVHLSFAHASGKNSK